MSKTPPKKTLATISAAIGAFLGFKIDSKKKLELTDAQAEDVDKEFGAEGLATKFMAEHNAKVEAETDNEGAMEAIQEYMASETQEEDEDGNVIPSAETTLDNTLTATVKKLTAKLKGERNKREQAEANLKKLKGEAEPDKPMTITTSPKETISHSATHLFGSNNNWDAFEGRSWNQLAAGQQGVTATDWNTANIDKLNSDIQDYFRKDPKKLHSTFMDGLKLPKYWKLISGVSDEYVFTTVSTGEITQGLKIKWLPKNNAKFEAQKGKVRDIEIDIEFKGSKLKKLEKSYLNNFFNSGSTPYKQDFILFVVKELMKQARKEDKIVMGKGVYFPNENAEVAGSFLNNFSGVIKLILDARDKYFKSFKLGKPTHENIYEYINSFADSLPHEIKILPDLVYYLSPSWLRAYNKARTRVKGTNTDYKGEINHIDGFSNIELLDYDQLEGYDLMFLTTQDNISALTDKPGEENVLKFQLEKRNTLAMGNYKLAAFIAAFGRKLIGKETLSYDNQLMFSNDVEALTNVYVPVTADNATPNLTYHNSLLVGINNTTATNITGFENATVGTKVYLLGNTDTNFSTVKDNENISLIDGDCVLEKNTLLVLYVKADGTFQELNRSIIGVSDEEVTFQNLDPDTAIIDASLATDFITGTNTKVTAISSITNAVKDETYRIVGSSDTNPSFINSGGLFAIKTDIYLTQDTFIDLYYNGSKFVETAREQKKVYSTA